MDLDDDGIPDILTGSWPGELYLFRGLGQGKFAPGQTLKDKDGQVINLGRASTVFAADWNGDGKLDLIVGNQAGQVQVMLNEGTAKQAAFGPSRKLEADGKLIAVGHGDSGPVAADWDGDGKPDLIVGAGDGSVLFFRNLGTAREPKLAAAVTLLPPGNLMPGQEGTARGIRAKVCVVDWNGDGKVDLLVGDFTYERPDRGKMTAAEKQAEQKARERLPELQQRQRALLDEQRPLLQPKETPEAMKERQARLAKLSAKLRELSAAAREATQKRLKYDRLAGNKMTEARKKAIDEARANATEAQKAVQAAYREVTELGRAVPDETPQQADTRRAEFEKAKERHQAALAKSQEAFRKTQRAQLPDLADLTPEDRKAAEGARAKEDQAQKAYQDFLGKEYRSASQPVEAPEVAKERLAKLQQVRERLDAVMREMSETQQVLRRYDATQATGFVWLYLRQATADAKGQGK